MKFLQPSLSGGEMSPGLHGRVDMARYAISLATCKNFITKPSGGAVKRPGWRFRTEVKTSANKTRILPFIYSTEVSYLIEAGNLYFRFLVNGAYLLDGSNNIVEVVTPYVTADLEKLRVTQSADVLYIAGVNGTTKIPPKELRRLTSTSFELIDHDFRRGPFRALNSREAVLMAVSAATGNVTVTVNSDTFNANLVGSYVYLEEKELRAVKPWEPLERNVAVGELRRSDGKVYRASAVSGPGSGGTPYYISGNSRPTHEFGRAWDGPGDSRTDGVNGYKVGVEWEYLHGGFGIVKLTGYVNATTMTGVVTERIPDGIVGTAPPPVTTWTLSGNGVLTQFSIPGAVSSTPADYAVTIAGVPVSANPYQPPTTGGGGSGGGNNTGDPGGDPCVSVDALLPGGILAGQVKVGDTLQLFDPVTWEESTGEVTYSSTKLAETYAITTAGGAVLTCSSSAPIPCRSGGYRTPADLLGCEVPVWIGDARRWDMVIDVTALGKGQVQHITVGDRCFWAGDTAGAYLLHHNLKPY